VIPPMCRSRDCAESARTGLCTPLTKGFIEAGICKECVLAKMPAWVRERLPYVSKDERKATIREWRDKLAGRLE
jgi:hypothetical protein